MNQYSLSKGILKFGWLHFLAYSISWYFVNIMKEKRCCKCGGINEWKMKCTNPGWYKEENAFLCERVYYA